MLSTSVDFYSKLGLNILIPFLEGELGIFLMTALLDGEPFISLGVGVAANVFLGDPLGEPAVTVLDIAALDVTLEVLGGDLISVTGAFFSLGLPMALMTLAGILFT